MQTELHNIVSQLVVEHVPASATAQCTIHLGGSSLSGLDADDSDVDFWLCGHPSLEEYGLLLRECLGAQLVKMGATRKGDVVDEVSNTTLKWHDRRHLLDASLNTTGTTFAQVLQHHTLLRGYYDSRPDFKAAVLSCAARLRIAGCMRSRKSGALDMLASSAFYTLCMALHPQMENDTVTVLESLCIVLARFDAVQHAVKVAFDAGDVQVVRRSSLSLDERSAALCVYRSCPDGNHKNLAYRVSDCAWAQLQHTCFDIVAHAPLLKSLYGPGCVTKCVDLMRVDQVQLIVPSSSHSPAQMKYMVYDHWRSNWITCVLNLWLCQRHLSSVHQPLSGKRLEVLLVLTGNANERFLPCHGYDFVCTLQWRANHASNPSWLPSLLVQLLELFRGFGGSAVSGVDVDVLGLSRGASALLYCCDARHHVVDKESGVSGEALCKSLARSCRYLSLAGGCIWQQQEPRLVDEVKKGLCLMKQVRLEAHLQDHVFAFIVQSHMDAQVEYFGQVERHRKKPRVVYGCTVEQLKEFTRPHHVHQLYLDDHAHVLELGLRLMEKYRCGKDIACVVNDIVHSGLIDLLHRVANDGVTSSSGNAVGPADSLVAFRALDDVASSNAEGNAHELASTNAPGALLLKNEGSCMFSKQGRAYPGRKVELLNRTALGSEIHDVTDNHCVVFVKGACGSGKTSRGPIEHFVASLKGAPSLQHGSVVLMETKETQLSLYEKLWEDNVSGSEMLFIWNGDPAGHVWPCYSSYIGMVSPRSYFNKLMMGCDEHDVQYVWFDEIQRPSAIMVVLLTHFLAQLAKNKRLRVFLVSATMQNSFVSALNDFLRVHHPALSVGEVTVHSNAVNAADNVCWVSAEELPLNFASCDWPMQVCMACCAIIRWARDERQEAAQILVLVPGEKEIVQVTKAWNNYWAKSSSQWKLFSVHGQTNPSQRSAVRKLLQDNACDCRCEDVIVIATLVFGLSVTLDINGFVDSNLEIVVNRNGFLCVGTSNSVTSTQRLGRAGRVRVTKCLQLNQAATVPDPAFCLPYAQLMEATLCQISLHLQSPLVGVDELVSRMCRADLEDLGVVRQWESSHVLTAFGERVCQHASDVQLGVLIETCHVLGIPLQGRIAAAFISGREQLFLKLNAPDVIHLHPAQCALQHAFVGHGGVKLSSDVHTAVVLYLHWVRDGRVTSSFVREGCLAKMHATLQRGFVEGDPQAAPEESCTACNALSQPGWEHLLALALAWAFQRYVSRLRGEDYMCALSNTDELRGVLGRVEDRGEVVRPSPNSLVHSVNAGLLADWMVFTEMLRYPTVSGMCALPAEIALLASRLRMAGHQSELRYSFLRVLHGFAGSDALQQLCSLWSPAYANQDALDGQLTGMTSDALAVPVNVTAPGDGGSVADFAPCVQEAAGVGEQSLEVHAVATLRSSEAGEQSNFSIAEALFLDRLEVEVLEDYEAALRRWSTNADASTAVQQSLEDLAQVRSTNAEPYFVTFCKILKRILPVALEGQGVCRRKIERWLRSTLRATRHTWRSSREVTGIFTPLRASAFMKNVFSSADGLLQEDAVETFPELASLKRKRCSQGSQVVVHRGPVVAAAPAPRYSQKIITERLLKAKDKVMWSNDDHCWIVRSCVFEELKGSDAGKRWQSDEFLSRREQRRVPTSEGHATCTQGIALAQWLNEGWTWTESLSYWRQSEWVSSMAPPLSPATKIRLQEFFKAQNT